MVLFKRKKEEEDYEDDLEERPRKRRPRSSEFKDLKPENKKKRKEPPKPWGRKERVFVFVILFSTIGVSSFLALSSRSWKLPGFPRLTIPAFSIPRFWEETIVLENQDNQISKLNQEKAKKAIDEFKAMTRNLTGVYGLYVVNLSNGFSYGVNENEVFQAASLIKLPVMALMFKEAENGNINLDQKYILKASDKVGGSGSLSGKPAGYEIAYSNLISLMGKQSDNTAFNICRNLLGNEKISGVIAKIGLSQTSLERNETTPYDVGVFFQELWHGNIVSGKNRDEILESLTGTIYEDYLAAGVPKEVRVAHKYGREIHVVNDAGIIFAKDPFVMVIMTKGIIEKEADEIFPELSRVIFEIEGT